MQVSNQIKPKFSVGQRLVSLTSGFNYFIERIYFKNNVVQYDIKITKPWGIIKGYEVIANMRWPENMLVDYLR